MALLKFAFDLNINLNIKKKLGCQHLGLCVYGFQRNTAEVLKFRNKGDLGNSEILLQ